FVMRLGVLAPVAVLVASAPVSAQADKPIELLSGLVHPGLTLKESDKAIHGFRLTGRVDKAGEGSGTLELDPTVPAFDDFGYQNYHDRETQIRLECTLKLVKKGKVQVNVEGRPGAPLVDVEWGLYEIGGPKIKSKLFVAVPTAEKWKSGRILVHD